MQRTRSHAEMLAILALTGCAGSGEGLDENGRPDTGGGLPPLTADFDSIQQNVFTPICTRCHVGATAPRGLRLEAGVSYAQLVGVPSVEDPDLLRVAPGDPDASYLVHKIEGRPEAGPQMPLGGPPLPQATIDVIRQWIVDGAQPSTGALSVDGPATLVAVSPTAPVPAGEPARIIVAADAELDTSLIHASNVTLIRSGGDGTFADGNESAVDGLAITITSLAPTVIAIALPANALVDDRFELRLAGSGPAPVAGRNAIVIDGDADGLPGGDFTFQFSVERNP
jgi:hypothetical protein